MTDKDREVIGDLIDAWEALPGGMSYSPLDIGTWLEEVMAPAMNKARKHMRRKVPKRTELRFFPCGKKES